MQIENDLSLYWIWLTQIRGIGPQYGHELIQKYGDPYQVYLAYVKKEIEKKTIPDRIEQIMEGDLSFEQAKRIQSKCVENIIQIATINAGLPREFSEYTDLPILLYEKGNLDKIDKGIGIVGARRCTAAAKDFVIMLAFDAMCQDEIVVSGMAKGIDSYAHTASLKEAEGQTIAVLGHGLDICYPKEHYKLFDSIVERGLVLSEYAPGVPPRKYQFTKRNRIISALSKQLYVVGIGRNSGALSTIEAAKQYRVPYEVVRL